MPGARVAPERKHFPRQIFSFQAAYCLGSSMQHIEHHFFSSCLFCCNSQLRYQRPYVQVAVLLPSEAWSAEEKKKKIKKMAYASEIFNGCLLVF